mmetsp:Transcript_82498/g.199961  ORF Transcript_82498/g.199961 Transcript_82498/m.199961 type:complete len:198 (+) Transcript_82498:84-677(+)
MAAIRDAVGMSFDKYDRDHSGTIDAYELSALCQALGTPLSHAEASRAMRYLDKDSSGKVEKEEFIDWWLGRGRAGTEAADLDGDGRVDDMEAQLGRVAQVGSTEALRLHIEKIRGERDVLQREVLELQEDRARVQKQMVDLEEQLSRINEDLARRYAGRNDIDTVLRETESAYMTILSSSKSLLLAVQRHIPRFESL